MSIKSKSLNGVKGWLLFWVIAFICIILMSLSSISYIYTLTYGNVPIYFSILIVTLLIGLLASVILILMHRKIGKWASVVTVSAIELLFIISVIITTWVNVSRGGLDSFAIMMLMSSLYSIAYISIFCIPCVMYFLKSERVKITLIK